MQPTQGRSDKSAAEGWKRRELSMHPPCMRAGGAARPPRRGRHCRSFYEETIDFSRHLHLWVLRQARRGSEVLSEQHRHVSTRIEARSIATQNRRFTRRPRAARRADKPSLQHASRPPVQPTPRGTPSQSHGRRRGWRAGEDTRAAMAMRRFPQHPRTPLATAQVRAGAYLEWCEGVRWRDQSMAIKLTEGEAPVGFLHRCGGGPTQPLASSVLPAALPSQFCGISFGSLLAQCTMPKHP